MKLIDSLRLVWRNLWRMKLRTILTSIGVMIGTAAIVAMISLSLGLRDNAVRSLESWGNLTEMEVQPAYWNYETNEPYPESELKKMNWEAVHELKQIEGVTAVMPTKQLYSSTKMKLGRHEGYIDLIGVDVREAINFKANEIEKGEFLSGATNEIVISYNVPRSMRDVEREKRQARNRNQNQGMDGGFGGYMPYNEGMGGGVQLDMVGKTATLILTRQLMVNDEPKFEKKEVRVRIVGQLQQDDSRPWDGNKAYVPLALVEELNEWVHAENGGGGGRVMYGRGMMSAESGKASRDRNSREKKEITFDSITVKVESREIVEQVVEKIQEKRYETWSLASQLKEINQMFFVIQMILGGIAAISLLVASIGIINTMIMSILERTREIGIMKVIGATVYNIRWLFLIESGSIGLIGGLAGLGIAYGAVEILNYIANVNSFDLFGGSGMGEAGPIKLAVIPMWLAGFAIGFSFLIGLLSGIFPAYRASRLSALEAIRSQ